MLVSNPDLINSCRVCRSPNQDGEYEYLYETAATPLSPMPSVLSHAGRLYEELLGEVSPETYEYYPRYLCNSCDLQMRLFKKLKDKAIKTMAYLSQLYGDQLIAVEEEQKIDVNVERILEVKKIDKALAINQDRLNQTMIQHKQQIMANTDGDVGCSSHVAYGFQDIESIIDPMTRAENDQCDQGTKLEQDLHSEEQRQDATGKVTHHAKEQFKDIENHMHDTIQEEENIVELTTHYPLETAVSESDRNLVTDPQVRSPIDKSDYVLEIYELLEDGTQAVQSEELLKNCESEDATDVKDFDIHEEDESQLDYEEEQYIDYDVLPLENNEQETKTPRRRKANKRKAQDDEKRREYKCTECSEIFSSSKDFKYHRENIHAQVYSCTICSKTFKSPYSLPTHMKIHDDTPAFQCELCERTFTQKIHYQYHMNRHNNIRNFRCDQCGKGFIGKNDLKIHMRQHNGHRPYVCDICGKDYMLSEHLKSHALKHTNQQFHCELCQQKFATPKTLRQHMQTIHIAEPKFKCQYCLKPFRRKHHLQYHMKQLHPSIDIITESLYDGTDDPEEVHKSEQEEDDDITVGDDLIEQDGFIQDPGYVALSDDAMLI